MEGVRRRRIKSNRFGPDQEGNHDEEGGGSVRGACRKVCMMCSDDEREREVENRKKKISVSVVSCPSQGGFPGEVQSDETNKDDECG